MSWINSSSVPLTSLPQNNNILSLSPTANLNIIVKYQYSTHDGHWRVDSYRDSYKMDRAQFKFTNLFNGNKQLCEFCDSVYLG